MPVVMVQKEIKAKSPKKFEVMVDNMCSVENITRFCSLNGYSVASAPKDDDYLLTLTKEG
jgi:TusA-related sulfurtransferase